jgi:hypothetical protein
MYLSCSCKVLWGEVSATYTSEPSTYNASRRPVLLAPLREIVRTIDVGLRRVEKNPRIRIRPSTTVWGVIYEQLLHPYRLQLVQALSPLDFLPNQELCHWFLRQYSEDPFCISYMLVTAEAGFLRNNLFRKK